MQVQKQFWAAVSAMVTMMLSPLIRWLSENRFESGQQLAVAQKSTESASWNSYEKQESSSTRLPRWDVHPGTWYATNMAGAGSAPLSHPDRKKARTATNVRRRRGRSICSTPDPVGDLKVFGRWRNGPELGCGVTVFANLLPELWSHIGGACLLLTHFPAQRVCS